jgi:hypothetical protein
VPIKSIQFEKLLIPYTNQLTQDTKPQIAINLFYVRNHNNKHTTTDELSYLQLIRSLGSNQTGGIIISAYHAELQNNTIGFANAIMSHEFVKLHPVDLVIAPASNSTSHEPYADATAKAAETDLVKPFSKQNSVRAGDNSTTYETLFNSVVLDERQLPVAIKKMKHFMLVDDVFATGKTAAVALSLLMPYLPKESIISVACVLRIDQEQGLDNTTLYDFSKEDL